MKTFYRILWMIAVTLGGVAAVQLIVKLSLQKKKYIDV